MGIVDAFIYFTTMLVKNRCHFSVRSWYFNTKITNWPINQPKKGLGKCCYCSKLDYRYFVENLSLG